MFGRYHVTEPKRFYDASAKWLVSPDPGFRVAVSSEPPVGGERHRERRDVGVEQQPAAGGDVDRRPDRALLPQHPIAERDRGPLHRHGAVRPGVVGQQPDAPGVVPHRELRSRAVRADERRSRCRRVRPCSGPVQVNNQIIRTATISHRDHAAQPAGLAGHPGQHAADPDRQLDHLRAAVLRPGPRRGLVPALPVRRRVLAGLRRVLRPERAGRARPDARPDDRGHHVQRVGGRRPAAPAPGRSRPPPRPRRAPPPPRPATTAPTTTTIPPATGSAQDLLNQAAAKLDQAQTALEDRQARRRTRRLVDDARTLVKQAQAEGRRLAALSRLSGPGWGSPLGLLLWP